MAINEDDIPFTSDAMNPAGPNQILNNPLDTGYGVKTPHKSADKSNTWNVAIANHKGGSIKLWAEQVTMDFSMSGSTGQSRFRKQFYPHSMNEPKITVMGKMPNQYEYNRLAAFIRLSHTDALNNVHRKAYDGSAGKRPPTIRMFIRGSSLKTARPIVKGGHKMHSFEGFIASIAAGATKFRFAPDFQFEFIPLASKLTGSTGLYDDQLLTKGIQIMSYMEMFNKNKKIWGVQDASDFAPQDAITQQNQDQIDQSGPPGTDQSVPQGYGTDPRDSLQ